MVVPRSHSGDATESTPDAPPDGSPLSKTDPRSTFLEMRIPRILLPAAALEAAATDICTSKDYAKTFPDCDGGIATNQQGPENDREWLTRGTKPGEVYLTYRDFAGGFPIIERSTDGGQTFSPCGTIIDPAGPAAKNYTPAGGTLVSKPIVGPDGTVYVEFTTPDA